MPNGRFIVVEGNDGSGKSTQTVPLVERLKTEGRKTHYLHFPNYESPFGALIKQILTGTFSDPFAMDPYAFSSLYSLDRFLKKEEIDNALAQGTWVVADRYESANEIYQSVRLADIVAGDAYIQWLRDFEFTKMKLPKPDLILYLYVPIQTSQKLLQQRGGGDKYDINEEFQLKVQQKALKLCEKESNWKKVDCVDAHGTLLSKEEISRTMWNIVQPLMTDSLN